MDLKKIRKIIISLSLILLIGGSGYWLGRREVLLSWQNFKPQVVVINKEAPTGGPADFSLFWEVWRRASRDFIDKTKIDPQKMIWGAISGMVQSLEDPYTVFLPPKENKEAKEELGGKFEGIGAQLGMKDKKIVVVAPLPGMPAQKAGILAGDVILEVDGEETIGWTLPGAVSKIRGPRGTKVVLNILHEDAEESVDIEIVRETIKVPSVELEIIKARCELVEGANQCQMVESECDDCLQVAHLQLMRFGDRTTEEWEKAVDEVGQQAAVNSSEFKGMILDVRNNPGGYLQGAVFIASEFLKSGAVVIQEDAQGRKETFSVNRVGRLTQVPLVVLVNKGSASASEIVAGVLKERKLASLVGEATFGKGSIQEAQDLPQEAGLHITTSKWLLPSGASVENGGLEPDVKIEDDLETEIDEQLIEAIEALVE